MRRPTRLEILKYALEGVTTYRGIWSGQLSPEEDDLTLDHLEWIKLEIARVEQTQETAK